eukprot:TRINITY_DN4910_c0_g1_i1.p1 TRINITY_DN4910_c0_g1~~TRINITY_DN4910_c0_g1_i1.p1  ORF type:complete len:341 (-),score=37.42 TRINITY_DN4910_c0_g1_i1:58-984(-)
MNPLVAPCQCQGSLTFVHERCLWKQLSGANSDCCPYCGAPLPARYHTPRRPQRTLVTPWSSWNFWVRLFVVLHAAALVLAPVIRLSTGWPHDGPAWSTDPALCPARGLSLQDARSFRMVAESHRDEAAAALARFSERHGIVTPTAFIRFLRWCRLARAPSLKPSVQATLDSLLQTERAAEIALADVELIEAAAAGPNSPEFWRRFQRECGLWILEMFDWHSSSSNDFFAMLALWVILSPLLLGKLFAQIGVIAVMYGPPSCTQTGVLWLLIKIFALNMLAAAEFCLIAATLCVLCLCLLTLWDKKGCC